MWLAPVQAVVLTVTDRCDAWASHVASELQKAGFRVSLDLRNEKLGKKVREAQLSKIPFMLVVGDSEVQGHTVTPRTRKGDSLESMSVDGIIDLFNKEIQAAFDSAVQ
jgi:threonyl-tRNA synthetase